MARQKAEAGHRSEVAAGPGNRGAHRDLEIEVPAGALVGFVVSWENAEPEGASVLRREMDHLGAPDLTAFAVRRAFAERHLA